MKVPKTTQQFNQDFIQRENALKNVVMRIIIEIRERKKRPKLSDFIAVYREKKALEGADDESAAKIKNEFQNKFRLLYGGDQVEEKTEDKKFDDLMQIFNRLHD